MIDFAVMLHRKGIVRHWHLVCLAHLALTHHALKAIDDTAKRLKEEIPLLTLRHRLDALRRQLRDDQIRGFTRRIRSPYAAKYRSSSPGPPKNAQFMLLEK